MNYKKQKLGVGCVGSNHVRDGRRVSVYLCASTVRQQSVPALCRVCFFLYAASVPLAEF